MRRFTVLRGLVHGQRIARKVCRRLAPRLSLAAVSSWWAVSTVATTGAAFVLGAAALVVSTIGAGVCWAVGWR